MWQANLDVIRERGSEIRDVVRDKTIWITLDIPPGVGYCVGFHQDEQKAGLSLEDSHGRG